MTEHRSESSVELAGGRSSELAPTPLPLAHDVPAAVWTALWVVLAFLVVSAGVLGR